MRTLIAFWAAAFAAPALFAGAVTLKVTSADVQPGGTASVTIDVAGDRGIGAMHVELTYDASVLSAEAVEAGPALQGATMKSNHETPGRVVLSIATDKRLKGGGTLATLRFNVVGKGVQESPLTLEKCKAWSDDDSEMLLPIETVSGTLRVVKPGPSLPIDIGSGTSSTPPRKQDAAPVPWLPIGIGAAALSVVLLVVATRGRKSPAGTGCPHCGAAASARAQFCPKCGKPRAAAVACAKCGAPFQGDAGFCAKCGTPRS